MAFVASVRFILQQETQRRKTKEEGLNEPQQTSGGAEDAFITAELQCKHSLTQVDEPGEEPAVIHHCVMLLHHVIGQSSQRPQTAIRDVPRPEHRPRVKGQREAHRQHPEHTGPPEERAAVSLRHDEHCKLN